MATRARAISSRIYQEFQPLSDWIKEEGSDTLRVHLPGFRREQIRVQIDAIRNIKITGERQLVENKWSRFHKDFSVPAEYDANAIGAKFENGILYIRMPKIITPINTKDQRKPIIEAPASQKPVREPQLNKDQEDTSPRVMKKNADKSTDMENVAKKVPKPTPEAPTSQEPVGELKPDKDQEDTRRRVTSTANAQEQMKKKTNESTDMQNVAKKVPTPAPEDTTGHKPEREIKPDTSAEKSRSANNVAEMMPKKAKEQSNGSADTGKITEGAIKKQEQVNESVDAAKIKDESAENVKDFGVYTLARYKKTAGKLVERRQLMLNMVVATVVVVALVAYYVKYQVN